MPTKVYLCPQVGKKEGNMQKLRIMGPMEALSASGRQLFTFRGRARRSEFWWTMLVVYLVSMLVAVLSVLSVPIAFRRLHDTGRSGWWWGGCFLFKVLLCVPISLKMIQELGADAADVEQVTEFIYGNKLLVLLMMLPDLLLLFLYLQDSEPRDNRYGPSTKYVEE